MDSPPAEPLALPVARIEMIICRALRVPQRTANDGRERAATVTRNATQIQRWETLCLVTGLRVAS